MSLQLFTGAACDCRPGSQRDNCTRCEATGRVLDFRAIRAATLRCKSCGARVDELTTFPGGICLGCHEVKFDAMRALSVRERAIRHFLCQPPLEGGSK